ncbi:response regulator [Geminocystis sp. CENA526]|uniref:response regulator n=1 Tax=Geminocystis sp. CENA526 TaxID=1355871 RepID=UPI003D6F05D2
MTNNHKKDILIVDDLADNLRVLSQILVEKNYQVRKAINGKTAIRAAQIAPPDLILLDIKMPEMDGYEVCQILKSNHKTAEIPVIFISALDDTLDKIKAFEVGGVDYVTKPFHVEEVLARIESQLTIQRQKQQLQKEIEQRKYTEEILHQSRAVLSSVLNSSLDGIAAIQAVRENATGNIIDFRCLIVNPVIAKVLGKDKSDLIGKIGIRKIIEKFDDKLFHSIIEVVETGKPLTTDLYYQCDSLKYWFHFIAVKLGDGCAVTIKNITHRKETELELKKINLDLETFSRSVVHDLRNYINNINFAGSLLEEEIDNKGSDNEKELIEIINTSCERTMKVLEGITHLSQLKIESIKPISFNLSQLVKEILNYLQNQEQRINFSSKIQDDVMINADRKLLNIAIENLIKNAWKYTQKKEETIIQFGEIKPTEKLWNNKIELANISSIRFKNKSIYYIKDNGIGFNPELADQLFIPFKKLHKDTSFEGSGIGLSIVKRIIELHEGEIWAESQLNKGAIFYFILGI